MGALYSEARKIRGTLLAEWDTHVKACGTCTSLTGYNRRFCDDGWELAKSLQAVKARVAELQEQLTDSAVTLF